MSHSRIFQVSRSPIAKEGRLLADDTEFDRFRVEIPLMDYFRDSESPRNEDLSWLASELGKIGFSLSDGKITIGSDGAFISTWKEEAVKSAEKFDLFEMQNVANGTFFSDMCIYDEDDGYPKPLWRWAYGVLESQKPRTVYHIGGILDYHL